VLFGADGRYFTGSFDGKRFTPDHKEKKALLHGSVYAGQCFSKPPDGRVVYIGWATFATKPGTSYNQHFTLPLHFTLHEEKASDGSIIHRIHINPVEELDKLHAKKLFNISGETITADNPKLTVDPQGDLLDITFTIRPVGNPETFKFQFGPDEFEYNFRDTRLRNHSAEPGRNHDILCPLQEGKLSMRILVDRPMYESFVNGGQFYLLTPRKMEERGKALTNMAFSFTGKEPADGIVIEKFQTHQMKSIWTKE
jgi:levanase/fructan beta-fructosidase